MNIQTMTFDELRNLNEQVVARMRQLRAAQNARQIVSLTPGMTGFYTHKGFNRKCRIVKVLRTNIDIIDLGTDKVYRMPASMFNPE